MKELYELYLQLSNLDEKGLIRCCHKM